MRWKLFADLADVAGERTAPVDAEPGDTVGDALDALFDRHPELRDRVLSDGEIADHVNLLRNGANVLHQDGLDTELEADDELALFPPVSGGRWSVSSPR